MMTLLNMPNSIMGAIIGLIIGGIVYIGLLVLLKTLTLQDINFFKEYIDKIKITKSITDKIVKIIEDKNLIYKQ